MYLNESSPKWSKRDPGCYMGQIIQEWTKYFVVNNPKQPLHAKVF